MSRLEEVSRWRTEQVKKVASEEKVAESSAVRVGVTFRLDPELTN